MLSSYDCQITVIHIKCQSLRIPRYNGVGVFYFLLAPSNAGKMQGTRSLRFSFAAAYQARTPVLAYEKREGDSDDWWWRLEQSQRHTQDNTTCSTVNSSYCSDASRTETRQPTPVYSGFWCLKALSFPFKVQTETETDRCIGPPRSKMSTKNAKTKFTSSCSCYGQK